MRPVPTVWDEENARASFVGKLRAAARNEQAARMLREFLHHDHGGPVPALGPESGGPAPQRYRASLVASQIIGLGFTRYVLRPGPVSSASPADLVAPIGPAIQRYLTGDLNSR